MKRAQDLGRWGEEQAAAYLSQHGYSMIAQNVRGEYGELDLIAQKDGETVFVEVKTRSSKRYGFPEEAITEQKRVHLIESAQAYLQAHPELEEAWRIDVISIQPRSDGGEPKITHFENAVS